MPSSAASAISLRSTLRGAWATSWPSMTQLPGTHASSLFQGRMITASGSGTANISGWAGVRSNHVAKPAKPAPSSCMPAIARAGTNLARCPPNRSVKEIIKYFMPFSSANFARSVAMINYPCCLCIFMNWGACTNVPRPFFNFSMMCLVCLGTNRFHKGALWPLPQLPLSVPPNLLALDCAGGFYHKHARWFAPLTS